MHHNPPLPDEFADFLAHWTTLKGAATAPHLADFLDKPIPSLQPWLSILDVEQDELVVRLFGTGVVNFANVELTGKIADEIMAPEGRGQLRLPHSGIIEIPCGALVTTEFATSTSRTVKIASLGLPLLRKGGASVAWLNQPAEMLTLGETGKVVRNLVSCQWVDLGYGVPR